MKINDIQRIGVLGAGLMGHAIAQVFASAGYRVHIYDADAALLERAKERISANFTVFIRLKLAGPGDRERCLEHVFAAKDLRSFCDGPQVIIEAISEEMTAKQNAYKEIEHLINEIIGGIKGG